jgi:predicted DNA-binding transcriptional regulator YafY
MSGKLSYERFFWFHREIKERRYPNATTLANRAEVNSKTAQRDIEFMRDRLKAPLVYSCRDRGYYYSDESFELPAVWLKPEEVTAFVIAKRLASCIPDAGIKETLKYFLDKFSTVFSDKTNLDINQLSDKISLKNIEYYNVNETVFEKTINALLSSRSLRINYYSPYEDIETKRTILPLHLLNYMGNWHLIAFCNLKKGLRNFVLSRIRECIPSKELISLPPDLPPIKQFIRQNFGIFSGKERYKVSLSFSPQTSRRVKEQVWHKRQKTKIDENGRLTLTVPVSDFREIKREILKFGADVEVISPAALKKEIKEEIKKMQKIYR